MNAPLSIDWTGPVSIPALEGPERCEFVDGEWRPKHPPSPPNRYLYRRGHEFVDGQWVEQPMSVESDYFGLKLGSAMLQHALATKAGRVEGSTCGYQCFSDDVRRIRLPDASFIRAERLTPEIKRAGNCPIAPDIAAEVISPNDGADELATKAHEYLRAGVQLVWLIFPKPRAVWILRANGTAHWLCGDSAVLTGEEVLPGFSISLDTLFADD